MNFALGVLCAMACPLGCVFVPGVFIPLSFFTRSISNLYITGWNPPPWFCENVTQCLSRPICFYREVPPIQTKLTSLLARRFPQGVNLAGEELFSSVLMTIITLLAGLTHIFLCFFFILHEYIPLAFISLASLLLYPLPLRLIYKRYHDMAGLVLSGLIVLYIFLSIYCVGAENYILLHLFTVLLMQLVIPFRRHSVRIISIVLLAVCAFCAYWLEENLPPMHDLGAANNLFGTINLLITFGAFVILLGLEKMLRAILEQHRHKREKELENQVYRDPLTGLHNRRYAEICFKELLASSPTTDYCVALADLDNFKDVNDCYGHAAGDAVLQQTAALLQRNLRKTDRVIRWGGEEFLLIINAKPADTYRLLEKMRCLVQDMVVSYGGQSIRISVTMGLISLDPKNVAASIEASDKKMYAGKLKGKNVVVV